MGLLGTSPRNRKSPRNSPPRFQLPFLSNDHNRFLRKNRIFLPNRIVDHQIQQGVWFYDWLYAWFLLNRRPACSCQKRSLTPRYGTPCPLFCPTGLLNVQIPASQHDEHDHRQAKQHHDGKPDIAKEQPPGSFIRIHLFANEILDRF